MSWVELGLIYITVGSVFFVVAVRHVGLLAASPALLLWPLWAPLALRRGHGPGDEMVERIDHALREGVEVSRGTDLDQWVSEEKRQRIVQTVIDSESRCRAIVEELSGSQWNPVRARDRLLELEQLAAPAAELADARSHLDRVRELETLREQELITLRELAETSELLKGQLVLARFLGSKAEGPSAIVPTLWSRVETLSATMRANLDAFGGVRDARVGGR